MNLGIMYNAGLPVPPGFIVTTSAFKEFLNATSLDKIIFPALKVLNVEDTTTLETTAKAIQDKIVKTQIPKEISEEVLKAYDALTIDPSIKGKEIEAFVKQGRDFPIVAVRSSATAEDRPEASFAGQQATFLNIKGQNKLLAAVLACWASLYTARAIYYRVQNKFEHENVLIAVVVQKMVNADVAGISFSVNPITKDYNEILLEASYGLGEAVVSGSLTPDEFIIDKETLKIKEQRISKKTWMYVKDPNKLDTVQKDVPKEKQDISSLSPTEIENLAVYTKKIEDHYQNPQDIEWAIERGRIYITQSRPITTLGEKKEETEEHREEDREGIDVKDALLLVSGIPASPGIGKGSVILVHDISDLSRIKRGNILVARMTTPDYVVAMERAAAIVTDSGGANCHAAIVSREMGIPCVVGTDFATTKLKEGQVITVDGTKGKAYAGNVAILEEKAVININIKTKTLVKVIMDLPGFAEHAAATGADGVGLLRGEFINLGNKQHPMYMIHSGKKEEFIENLTKNLKIICEAFKGKPVWYRTLDARTDEFRNLIGGESEPDEDNPMMGWRSVRRSLDEPDVFKAEFEAIKRVRNAGYNTLGVMIPMITHKEQIHEVKRLFREQTQLEPVKDIEFGIMIETPAAATIIEDLCKEGISFASIGTNDLTQFTLACDRNSSHVAKWYDEMHPAVLSLIKKVIKTCRRYNVESSICGQAGSRQDMAKFLYEQGITSISANPDAVSTIRRLLADLEK